VRPLLPRARAAVVALAGLAGIAACAGPAGRRGAAGLALHRAPAARSPVPAPPSAPAGPSVRPVAAPSVAPPPPLPEGLPPEVARFSPARDWKVVVLHHSATATGGMAAFHRMHEARGWDGVGYHFVVGNGTDTPDGALETTFRWREQREGAHAKGWNDLAIGVCLVGNFEETAPTPAQVRTLTTLLRWLRERFRVPAERVVGHGRLGETLCPGARFPVAEVVAASAPVSRP
jgi:N-acetylmuramoyl-L-alanine amidase